eukprot:12240006-Ditylum_brightwellii.AAC.1
MGHSRDSPMSTSLQPPLTTNCHVRKVVAPKPQSQALRNTMSRSMRTITGSVVKDLVGLDTGQLIKLKHDYNIMMLQDLALLSKADVDTIFGDKSGTF